MTGELWIDASQERITRLEGHLQQDTTYGWGILGKLDKGGWIVIEQAAAAGLEVQITGNGTVREQAPAAGSWVAPGTKIVVRCGQ